MKARSGAYRGRFEKHVFERRLKRSAARESDRETRADFALRCAEDFDLGSSGFFEFGPDSSGREIRRIAILAEMPQHDPGDLAGQQLRNHCGGRAVREMTMSGLDPLFHRPRPM